MVKDEKQADVIEIDLLELFFVLLHKLVWIILIGGIVAGATFAVTEFALPPIYESTTKIYILNKQDNGSVTYSDVQIGTQLTKDYAELVKSRSVLDAVIQDMNLGMKYNQLLKKVKITTPTDTRILAITVEDENPVLAMQMADKIREVAAVHITNVMDIEAVNVVENANLPEMKSKPHVVRSTLIGGMLGAFVVCVIILIKYIMDDTIKTTEDVEKYLQLSTLAMIPLIEENEGSRGKKKKKEKHHGHHLGKDSSSENSTDEAENNGEIIEIIIDEIYDLKEDGSGLEEEPEETEAVQEQEEAQEAAPEEKITEATTEAKVQDEEAQEAKA